MRAPRWRKTEWGMSTFKGSGGTKREGDQLHVGLDRMKRMRSASPATSDFLCLPPDEFSPSAQVFQPSNAECISVIYDDCVRQGLVIQASSSRTAYRLLTETPLG